MKRLPFDLCTKPGVLEQKTRTRQPLPLALVPLPWCTTLLHLRTLRIPRKSFILMIDFPQMALSEQSLNEPHHVLAIATSGNNIFCWKFTSLLCFLSADDERIKVSSSLPTKWRRCLSGTAICSWRSRTPVCRDQPSIFGPECPCLSHAMPSPLRKERLQPSNVLVHRHLELDASLLVFRRFRRI